MAHTRVKFTDVHEGGEEIKGWHLLTQDKFSDNEYTACGLATPEYETKMETVEKGKITCEHCLGVIRYYKSIKL